MSSDVRFSASDFESAVQLARQFHLDYMIHGSDEDLLYDDIKDLMASLEELRRLLHLIQTRDFPDSSAGTRQMDNISTTLDTLPDVTGNFMQTLNECCDIRKTSDLTFRQHQYVLQRRLRFHTRKTEMIARAFVKFFRLPEGRDWEHNAIPNKLAEATAFRYQSSLVTDSALDSRFSKASDVERPSAAKKGKHWPLKEGFDALAFRIHICQRLGDLDFSLRDLNLYKLMWIKKQLESSPFFVIAGPHSLWAIYMEVLEIDIQNELCHTETHGLISPGTDIILNLPDSSYKIWVEKAISQDYTAVEKQYSTREKILELARPSNSSVCAPLTVYRLEDHLFCLVTFLEGINDQRLFMKRVIVVDMKSTRLIPPYTIFMKSSAKSPELIVSDDGIQNHRFALKDFNDAASLQRALTGYRVDFTSLNVQWTTSDGWDRIDKGNGGLQLWAWRPLLEMTQDDELIVTRSSFANPAFSSDQKSASNFDASVPSKPATVDPPLDPKIIATMATGDYCTSIQIELHRHVSVNRNACDCGNSKKPCTKVVLESNTRRLFDVQKLSVETIFSLGDLALVQHNNLNDIKTVEDLILVKRFVLEFPAENAKDQFLSELTKVEMLRDRAKAAYEADQAVSHAHRDANLVKVAHRSTFHTSERTPPRYPSHSVSKAVSQIGEGDNDQSKRYSEESEDENDENDEGKEELVSYTARTQNIVAGFSSRAKSQPRLNQKSFGEKTPHKSYRIAHEEREKLRKKLFSSSLFALRNESRTHISASLFKSLLDRGLNSYPSNESRNNSWLGTEDPTGIDIDLHPSGLHIPAEGENRIVNELYVTPYGNMSDFERIRGQLLLFRNKALLIYNNCRRMQIASLASENISTLQLNLPRPVVMLDIIKISDIKEIVGAFSESIVSKEQFLSLTLIHSIDRAFQKALQASCLLKSIVDSLGSSNNNDTFRGVTMNFDRWDCLLQVVDFGILLYGRVHLGYGDIDEQDLEGDNHSLIFPHPSLVWYYPNEKAPSVRISCRRYNLRCLAPFLSHQRLWAFGPCSGQWRETWPEETTIEEETKLYLSTRIETFADVWGPVWKTEDRLSRVSKYKVGDGSIIPYPEATEYLAFGERMAHWESDAYIENPSSESLVVSKASVNILKIKTHETPASPSATKDTAALSGDETQSQLFNGKERLLIGATCDFRLRWRACRCSVEELTQKLREAERLDYMMASKAYRYIDSQQTSLVVGSHGVTIGKSQTMKEKKEDPLKIGFLAEWENEPQSRNPRLFESFWGVLVSLCTMNAQRVRLVYLLGETSVVALLQNFKWSDTESTRPNTQSKIFASYLEAVRSPDPWALGDLWDDHPLWQQDIGNAMLICLRVLTKTGYDGDRDEFHMLWLPQGCHGSRRVTLKCSDQKWIRFLKDTRHSMSATVLVEDSLCRKRTCGEDRSAWYSKPSILETAISINRDLEPFQSLIKTQNMSPCIMRRDEEAWKSFWDVSGLSRGDLLSIGTKDRLRVVRSYKKWHIRLEMDTILRDRVRDFIGMRSIERLGHWEYTEEQGEPLEVSPIPVQIVS